MANSKQIEKVTDADDCNKILDCDLDFLSVFDDIKWKTLKEFDYGCRIDDDYDSEEDLDQVSVDRQSFIIALNLNACQPQFGQESTKDMKSIDESGHVKKCVLIEGIGDELLPENCNVISSKSLAYAQGADDDDPFDSTFDRKRPDRFSLNDDRILKGFSIALKSMKVGEVSKFLVHPDFAYRSQGHEPRIPKNDHILYLVELVRILSPNPLTDVLFLSKEDKRSLPFEDVLKAADFCKKEGKSRYDNGDHVAAVKILSAGISVLEEYPTRTKEETEGLNEQFTKLGLYKAQCFLKLEQPPRACNALKLAVQTEHDELKAKACLLFVEVKLRLNALDHAEKYFKQATQLFKSLGQTLPSKCQELRKLISEFQLQPTKVESKKE